MDENTRRYYLDAMGIQCWESIIPPQANELRGIPSDNDIEKDSDREVAADCYAAIDEAVQNCTKCTLHKTRKQALIGRGDTTAELMFVVLSPLAGDDETGVLCSGAASELFSKMLAAIDIKLDDVYITSLLKCRVPDKHTVSPKEIRSCNNFLSRQIQLIKPALVVVLGETAVRCLLQKEVSIDDCREKNSTLAEASGQQLESIPLFFSYSPEELLQQPDNKRKAWSDLQLLQKLTG